MNPNYEGRIPIVEDLNKMMTTSHDMLIPPFDFILQNKLASQGFSEYWVLGKKLFETFSSFKENLPKKHYFDFGLRAMLATMRTAGAYLR